MAAKGKSTAGSESAMVGESVAVLLSFEIELQFVRTSSEVLP
jgi:hypothetical protein